MAHVVCVHVHACIIDDLIMYMYIIIALYHASLFLSTFISLPTFISLQVYRLQNQIDSALSDLDTAVSLSSGRGKVAEQAHTQRGLIRRLQGENEGALEDFKTAAKLGSRFAQKQVVAMNPYAALCNQMLTEAFGKLRRGEAV